jgi:hypothetical protein
VWREAFLCEARNSLHTHLGWRDVVHLICYLLRERSTAVLLLEGLLAPVWKLKSKKLSSLKTEIDAALAARFV